LVQSAKINCYRDLPSEHWEELVEAWMCHSDQKLNSQVANHGKRGFWPSAGQAFVGGSYILFEEGVMNAANLHIAVDKKVCTCNSASIRIALLATVGRTRRLALAISTNGCVEGH
jgi:hypothetical protein